MDKPELTDEEFDATHQAFLLEHFCYDVECDGNCPAKCGAPRIRAELAEAGFWPQNAPKKRKRTINPNAVMARKKC